MPEWSTLRNGLNDRTFKNRTLFTGLHFLDNLLNCQAGRLLLLVTGVIQDSKNDKKHQKPDAQHPELATIVKGLIALICGIIRHD